MTSEPAAPERWAAVVGYEDVYEVSTLGRVRRVAPAQRTHPGRILSPGHNSGGYPLVNLSVGGVDRTVTVHRLVALAFLGDPPTREHQVNHKNGIRSDNRIENLEWCTPLENVRHAIDVLRRDYRSKQGSSGVRLTEATVASIRARVAAGEPPLSVAADCGVSRAHIYRIINRRAWARSAA